jgi:hypothetical protein
MTRSLVEAIRGPVLLVALGVILAADQLDRVDLSRTWPVLLIVFGVLKLAEHLAAGVRRDQVDAAGGGA